MVLEVDPVGLGSGLNSGPFVQLNLGDLQQPGWSLLHACIAIADSQSVNRTVKFGFLVDSRFLAPPDLSWGARF